MNKRLQKLEEILKENDLDAVALNPGPSFLYMTGMDFHLMERPVLALFARGADLTVVHPGFEGGKLEGLSYPVRSFPYGDDPSHWGEAFREGFKFLAGKKCRIGVEPNQMRVLEESYLKAALPEAEIVLAGKQLAALRLHKDAEEQKKMRQAALIAQEALIKALAQIRPGWTEKQIAGELVAQLIKAGSEGASFNPIVAVSENAANPHAQPGERQLREGDLLLFDFGAGFGGYFSDITRVFSCGQLSPQMEEVAGLVCRANQAAREGAKPGMPAGAVDDLARNLIKAGGYGDYFTHRTGHGLGMEIHEEPYIFAGNPLILEEGMTFTIEPGIYLPGKFGVRIEDDVVVTATGLQSLTDLPREVRPLEDFWK